MTFRPLPGTGFQRRCAARHAVRDARQRDKREFMTRLLIVDDEPGICWGLEQLGQRIDVATHAVSTAEEGLAAARQQHFDAVVLDVRLPGIDGIEALPQFRSVLPDSPILIITAFGELSLAIQAIQAGAFDYIAKPFSLQDIQTKIQMALAAAGRSGESRRDRVGPDENAARHALIGSSPVMQEVYKQIALATTSQSPILIRGESGTGKELAARAIHEHGPRSNGPFVAVNIASLSPTLVESELFGHDRGAFTGAARSRPGLVELAAGGTLFLDEVAEIPLEIQAKLLRVLDFGEITRVGESQPRSVDFRLITATHQNLDSLVRSGEFRHDLLFRIRAFEIQMPTLGQRLDDVEELVRHFLLIHSPGLSWSWTREFIEALKQRTWPGNVRQLRHAVESAAIRARMGVLGPEHLDEPRFDDLANHASGSIASGTGNLDQNLQTLTAEWISRRWDSQSVEALYEEFLRVVEPTMLKTAYDLAGQQYATAARRLGIHRTTLKKKLDGEDTD